MGMRMRMRMRMRMSRDEAYFASSSIIVDEIMKEDNYNTIQCTDVLHALLRKCLGRSQVATSCSLLSRSTLSMLPTCDLTDHDVQIALARSSASQSISFKKRG